MNLNPVINSDIKYLIKIAIGNASALGFVEIDKLGMPTKSRACYGSGAGLPGGSLSRVRVVSPSSAYRYPDPDPWRTPQQNHAIPRNPGPESSLTPEAAYRYSSIKHRLPFGPMRK